MEAPAKRPSSIVTLISTTHPWMCDRMGHVNVRHYSALFDDASFQLLGYLDRTGPDPSPDLGWADVRCEYEFHREMSGGLSVSISSHVEKIGGSSVVHLHRLSNYGLPGIVYASARVVSVRFDLTKRLKIPLDSTIRTRAEALLAVNE